MDQVSHKSYNCELPNLHLCERTLKIKYFLSLVDNIFTQRTTGQTITFLRKELLHRARKGYELMCDYPTSCKINLQNLYFLLGS